jgi:hypothetical protein
METSNKLTGEQLSLWTSSAADTPANHLAPQENDEGQTTQDICGHGYETPLAHYDPDTRSWKTSGDISLWGEQPSLESLPKAGMTRNGVLYQQLDWVRPIDETASSLWPTPTTQENEHPGAIWNEKWRRVSPSGVSHGMNLADAVRIWPTPTAKDGKGASGHRSEARRLADLTYRARIVDGVTTGSLNPTWVEWLMGFPIGWTDLED